MKIFALAAHDGDCLFIKSLEKQPRYILIDGGRRRKVIDQLENFTNQILSELAIIDLLVVTHVDSDHIYGIIKGFEKGFFSKKSVGKILFNSRENLSKMINQDEIADYNLPISGDQRKISFNQGETFWNLIKKYEINILPIVSCDSEDLVVGDMKLTFLSPTIATLTKLLKKWEIHYQKDNDEISFNRSDHSECISDLLKKEFTEDTALPNKSSISFILERGEKRILMLGDSHPSVILSSLKEKVFVEKAIYFDLVKISHHGSRFNTSPELLEMIDCQKFLISVCPDNIHSFPHKETLAKIVERNYSKKVTTEFFFNYQEFVNSIFSEQEKEKWMIRCYGPETNSILEIDI